MPKHHFFVGTWTPPGAIFAFEFDDESLDLSLVKRIEIPENEPISWMTISHDKKALYGASMKKWSSHAIKSSPTDVLHTASYPMTHDPEATKAETRTRAIFCLAALKAPYNLYCNPFYEHAGFGSIFSVDQEGTLKECIQNYEYAPGSAIHGMVFDPKEEYIYSADMWGNKIWCHKKDSNTGKLETVGFVEAPKHKDQPRWVAMHPCGVYLYVLMEHGNTVNVYTIHHDTHLPVYTNVSYPLVPEFLVQRSPSLYRSDVCVLTPSSNTLFATSRSNKAGIPGYISAFSLTPSGAINRQLCLQPTTTSGGHSNAVSFYPGSKEGEEWMALTDDEVGFVEMYRWDGKWLARVGRCEVKEPGFGMNAVWYD